MKLNLKKIIKDYKLNPQTIAKELYPTNRNPVAAMKRVLDDQSDLNSEQISKLSFITNATFDELFNGKWTAKTKKDIITFSNGNFNAYLDTKTFIISMYKRGGIKHQTVISSRAISLPELVSLLDEMIK